LSLLVNQTNSQPVPYTITRGRINITFHCAITGTRYEVKKCIQMWQIRIYDEV